MSYYCPSIMSTRTSHKTHTTCEQDTGLLRSAICHCFLVNPTSLSLSSPFLCLVNCNLHYFGGLLGVRGNYRVYRTLKYYSIPFPFYNRKHEGYPYFQPLDFLPFHRLSLGCFLWLFLIQPLFLWFKCFIFNGVFIITNPLSSILQMGFCMITLLTLRYVYICIKKKKM